MICNDMVKSDWGEKDWGWSLDVGPYYLCFGNRNANLSELQKAYPNYQFLRLKQVHGDRIVEFRKDSPDYALEADGSWTTEPGLALCSISADCVPILISSSKTKFIMALHAGWRGVAKRILVQGIELAIKNGIPAKDLRIHIGPHIMAQSFEIQQDTLDLLTSATTLNSEAFTKPLSGGKFLADLNRILAAQALECGISPSQILSHPLDTLTDSRLHSFRRDREKAGRQISFIVIKFPG